MERTLNLSAVRDEYLLNCQIDGKAKGTLDIYSHVTRLFLEYLGDDPEITPTRIRGFLLWLSEVRHQNPTTVNINCRALRTFMRWLAREEYLTDDPMRDIKTPKVPSKFPNVLSGDELRKMLAIARRDPRDNAILLSTGTSPKVVGEQQLRGKKLRKLVRKGLKAISSNFATASQIILH